MSNYNIGLLVGISMMLVYSHSGLGMVIEIGIGSAMCIAGWAFTTRRQEN